MGSNGFLAFNGSATNKQLTQKQQTDSMARSSQNSGSAKRPGKLSEAIIEAQADKAVKKAKPANGGLYTTFIESINKPLIGKYHLLRGMAIEALRSSRDSHQNPAATAA